MDVDRMKVNFIIKICFNNEFKCIFIFFLKLGLCRYDKSRLKYLLDIIIVN